jgi:flagellar protein FlaG
MGEITSKSAAASVIPAGAAQLNQAPGMGTVVSARTNTDAQVVSAAASVEFKPSNIQQITQQSRQAVEAAAQQMQSFVSSMGRNLDFSIDGSTGYHVVRVTNPSTGEVIRQMPSDEVLRLAHSFDQISALIHQKA